MLEKKSVLFRTCESYMKCKYQCSEMKVFGTQPCSSLYGWSVAALAAQQRSCILTTEVVVPVKPTLFIWPFTEEVCQTPIQDLKFHALLSVSVISYHSIIRVKTLGRY